MSVHFDMPSLRRGGRALHAEPLPISYRPRRPVVEVFVSGNDRALVPNGQQALPIAPDFLFCVEFSMLVRSRNIRHRSASTLLDEISSFLTHAGIPNHVHNLRHNAPENYKDWTLLADPAIPSQPSDSRFAVRIVSPLMHFAPEYGGHWIPSVEIVMSVLNYEFETTTSHGCGTHIHLVPARGFWTLAEAKRLARAVLHFERLFDALMPPYRRRSVWAKSNRHNKYMRRRKLGQCVEAIDIQTSSFAALVARMNWTDAASPTGLAMGKVRDFAHDAYRWDFTGVDTDGRGTIVFRQPPGVTDSAQAIRWILLAGCLVRLTCMYKIDICTPPDPTSLGEWIYYEAYLAGFGRVVSRGVKSMFDRADLVDYSSASGRDHGSITEAEAESLRVAQALGCNVGQEKFKDWAVRHCSPRRIGVGANSQALRVWGRGSGGRRARI